MIKGSQLIGRAIIDMEAAQRLGKIKEIIVQHDGERVAGFVVVHGETIVGTGGTLRTIASSALHSIGPDAVTVRGSALKERASDLNGLPRMSDVIGRKMVTHRGRLLGSIDDMLIDGANGTIFGYVVGEGVRNKLENILNPQRARVRGYVRADADLHVGNDLVVVPDDALIEGEPGVKGEDYKPSPQKTVETDSRGWEKSTSNESTRSSVWTRRTNPPARNRSQTPAETRVESETDRPVENERAVLHTEAATPESLTPVSEDQSFTAAPQDKSHPT